ncbi:MAG: hypothetical protein OEY77_00180 [Nitrospira sp.]|nr:hypothetical protein [Nitrospira sp.]
MSLLLAQSVQDGTPVFTVGVCEGVAFVVGVGVNGIRVGVGFCLGLATVIGVGIDGDAVGGTRQFVRKVYETDPPNRFWPDPSIHTY